LLRRYAPRNDRDSKWGRLVTKVPLFQRGRRGGEAIGGLAVDDTRAAGGKRYVRGRTDKKKGLSRFWIRSISTGGYGV